MLKIINQYFLQVMPRKHFFPKFVYDFNLLMDVCQFTTQGQCFDKSSLNAASYKTAICTDFVHTAMEPELKDLQNT